MQPLNRLQNFIQQTNNVAASDNYWCSHAAQLANCCLLYYIYIYKREEKTRQVSAQQVIYDTFNLQRVTHSRHTNYHWTQVQRAQGKMWPACLTLLLPLLESNQRQLYSIGPTQIERSKQSYITSFVYARSLALTFCLSLSFSLSFCVCLYQPALFCGESFIKQTKRAELTNASLDDSNSSSAQWTCHWKCVCAFEKLAKMIIKIINWFRSFANLGFFNILFATNFLLPARCLLLALTTGERKSCVLAFLLFAYFCLRQRTTTTTTKWMRMYDWITSATTTC